jgi:hypothetical protein
MQQGSTVGNSSQAMMSLPAAIVIPGEAPQEVDADEDAVKDTQGQEKWHETGFN